MQGKKEILAMMMLAPSILAADFAKLGVQVVQIDKAGAQQIHIDVMDGVFVPSISFGFPIIRSIRKLTDKFFDVHLMITEPERYVEEFAEAGADGIDGNAGRVGRSVRTHAEIHDAVVVRLVARCQCRGCNCCCNHYF